MVPLRVVRRVGRATYPCESIIATEVAAAVIVVAAAAATAAPG